MPTTENQRFHDGIRATLQAGIPLELHSTDGNSRPKRVSIDMLKKIESQVSTDGPLNDGPSWQQLITQNPNLPPAYLAGLQVATVTGNSTAPLQGWSARPMAEAKVREILRRTFVYLSLVVLVAVVGLFLFVTEVTPVLMELRYDLELTPAVKNISTPTTFAWILPLISAIAIGWIMMMIWMLMGGTNKVAMWLGGKHYVRCQNAREAVRIARLLRANGQSADQATEISGTLTGLDEASSNQILTELNAPSQGSAAARESADDFDSLTRYLELSARRRLGYMKIGVPITLVTFIGGVVAMLYCVTLFWPIVSLLRDLPSAGI